MCFLSPILHLGFVEYFFKDCKTVSFIGFKAFVKCRHFCIPIAGYGTRRVPTTLQIDYGTRRVPKLLCRSISAAHLGYLQRVAWF